jgi:glycosyltransferase involved in cell wall biosynthesis
MIDLERIDYIIPTWNSGATLEAALVSIERYGNPNEIIIVDRCSEDETLEIARKYKCKIIESTLPLGAARIAGAKASQSELIGFVDSDVELKESWQELMKCAQQDKYKDAGVFGAHYDNLLSNNEKWPIILEKGNGAFGCIITYREHILECEEMKKFSSAEDGVYARCLSKKGLKWYIFPFAVRHHQDLTPISCYARLKWLGAGLRVKEGFKWGNVKKILGGAIFGIKMYNSEISYFENWKMRGNYLVGYVRYKKYYEINRNKIQ